MSGGPEPKSKISIELILGVCIKNTKGEVLSQNEICRGVCGDRLTEICKDGCMKEYSIPDESEAVLEAISTIHNIHEGDVACDAVVIHTGSNIVTLLYLRGRQIDLEVEMFRKMGLTEAEQAIVLLILDGLSNREIAKRLFISLSTVKTHINHIYGKLPEKLRDRVKLVRSK